MKDQRYIIYHKSPETYIYRYDENSRVALTQLLCRQAANPEFNLSWYDAALILRTVKSSRNTTVRF